MLHSSHPVLANSIKAMTGRFPYSNCVCWRTGRGWEAKCIIGGVAICCWVRHSSLFGTLDHIEGEFFVLKNLAIKLPTIVPDSVDLVKVYVCEQKVCRLESKEFGDKLGPFVFLVKIGMLPGKILSI